MSSATSAVVASLHEGGRAAVAVIATCLCAGAAVACPVAGEVAVTITAVEPRLELRLEDGRRVRLVGLDPAGATPGDPDLGETSRVAMAKTILGRSANARFLSATPDRWGRLPAEVFVGGEPVPGGLAAVAVAAGLGRYRPEEAAHSCRETLLAAEEKARLAGLGLWRDPYYGLLAADDREAFNERSATEVVAQGRVWRVDRGPFRTKLRFTAPGEVKRDLLVAVVSPKVLKRFEEQGVHFETLTGRTIRLRGLLDLRFGPQVEITTPDALELLADAAAVASP